MATLYVENIPDELYEALRARAPEHRKSIAPEVLALLRENVVTPKELKSRQAFLQRVERLRSRRPDATRKATVTEEIQREDRAR